MGEDQARGAYSERQSEPASHGWLSLHRPSGRRVQATDNGGVGRNATLWGVYVDESGPWTVQVRTRNRVNQYGRYDLRVRLSD